MLKYFFFFLITTTAFAQQQQDGTLELPEFVITGKEHIDVPQAERLAPPPMSPIDSASLERFRAVDRELTELIPRMPRPSPIPLDKIFRGNAFLGAGRFSLPVAGLEFGVNGGALDAHGRGAYTSESAYTPNAERSFSFAQAALGISLPENIFFFGRARLSLNVDGDGRRDNLLYTQPLAVNARTMSSFYVSPQIDGLFNGVRYNGNVRIGVGKLGCDSVSENEKLFHAHVFAEKNFETAGIGITFSEETRSLDQTGITQELPQRDFTLFQLGGAVWFAISGRLRASAKLFFNEVETIYHERSQYIMPEVGISYSPDSVMALSLNVGSKLMPVTTSELLRQARFVPLEHLYAVVDVAKYFIAGDLDLHSPDKSISAHSSVTFSSFEQKSRWLSAPVSDTARQLLKAELTQTSSAENAKRLDVVVGLLFSISPFDKIIADVSFFEKFNSYEDVNLPFATAHVAYRHTFLLPVSAEINADYRSATTLANKRLIFGAESEYQFHENFSAFLRLTNIANAKYEEWFGYAEPPLGGIIGIRARW